MPERQALRDLINEIANPPKGSEDELREQFKAELEVFPWATVTPERFVAQSETEVMVTKPPDKVKRYRVTIRTGAPTAPVLRRRSLASGLVMAGLPEIPDGEIVVGDNESWSTDDPNLFVHVYVPNAVQPSMGCAAPEESRSTPPTMYPPVLRHAVQPQARASAELSRAQPSAAELSRA